MLKTSAASAALGQPGLFCPTSAMNVAHSPRQQQQQEVALVSTPYGQCAAAVARHLIILVATAF